MTTDYPSRQARYEELARRLGTIRSRYDLEALAGRDTGPREIAAYYRASDFFYNLLHSLGGHNIHMGLSADGVWRKSDLMAQARFVAEHMGPEVRRVLEVGAGRCANTRYLARLFPDVEFTAMDLPDRRFLRTRVPKNVTLAEGDYHDLTSFGEAAFDLVFAVETLCHAGDKGRVYRQLARVLRPGGKLIVFDVFEPLPPAEMTDFERFADRVILAAMCVTDRDQYIGGAEAFLRAGGFSGIETEDLTSRIRPSLARLDRLSALWFSHPRAAGAAARLIPPDAHRNSIAGWLMLPAFDGERLLRYARILAVKM